MDSPYDIMKGSFWTFIQFIPTFNWESDKKPSPKRNHVWSLQFDPSPYPPYPVPTWPPQVGWNAPIHEGCLESGVPPTFSQWEFQDPIDWRYLPYIRPIFQGYVREYPHKIWPYMVQYLHVRILKFPLILCLNWPVAGRPPFHNDPFEPPRPKIAGSRFFVPQYIPWNIYTYPMYITLYPGINWITIWLVIPHGVTCTSYRGTDGLLGFESLYNAQIIFQWWLV